MFSTLNSNAEDAVTPAAALVPVHARRPPIRITSLQDFLDAGEIDHDFFSERREPDVRSDRNIGLENRGARRFRYDFDVRTSEKVFGGRMLGV